MRVSLGWRCELCAAPNVSISSKPILGSRFMCYRHSSTRLDEDTKSNTSNIISFHFGSVSSYAPIWPLSTGHTLSPAVSARHQDSDTTPRTKLAQADAPAAVLNTSPCKCRVQTITPMTSEYNDLAQWESQTYLKILSLSQAHPRSGGTLVPIQDSSRP